MKRHLLFGLAVALLLSLGQAVWAQPDGLMAYWPFDEGSGTTAADMSGNGNDGTLNGDAQWVEGMLGGAIQFSGSNGSYVSAPHIPIDSRTFTVALWANASLSSGEQVVFAQHQSGSQNLSLHYRITGGGVVRMGFYSNDMDTPGGTIEAGVWTHIAFVSETTGNSAIYTMNPDGSGQTNITGNPWADYYPQWSPNGDRIVFVSERDVYSEIYVMSASGSDQTALTRSNEGLTRFNVRPIWSPAR